MSFFLYLLFFVYISSPPFNSFFFFFNDTATTEIYTLSLHDALPIWYTSACCRGLRFCCDSSQSCNPRQRAAVNHPLRSRGAAQSQKCRCHATAHQTPRDICGALWFPRDRDRKSTRLNSSHGYISYAVFC